MLLFKKFNFLVFIVIFTCLFFIYIKKDPLKTICNDKVLYNISNADIKNYALSDSDIKKLNNENEKSHYSKEHTLRFNINNLKNSESILIGLNVDNKASSENEVFVKLYDRNFKEITFPNKYANVNNAKVAKGKNSLVFIFDKKLIKESLKNVNLLVFLSNDTLLNQINIYKQNSNYPFVSILCYIALSILYTFLILSICYILYAFRESILNFKNIFNFLFASFCIIFLISACYKFNYNFFKAPLSFSGYDDTHFLSVAKNALDGNGFWYMNDMQAPFGVKRYDFPMLMAFYYGFFKFFGFFTSDVILVNNFYYLCTFLFAFFAFYFFSRKLSIVPSLCILGGILFTFSQYHFARSVSHVTASSYFVSPLMLYLCYLVGIDKRFNEKFLDNKNKLINYSLIIIFCSLIGSTDIFYAYFGSGFLVISILYAFFKDRRTAALRGIFILFILVAFLISNLYPAILNNILVGSSKASSRSAFQAFYYGLMLVHLFIPYIKDDHVFSWLARKYLDEGFFKGEMLTSYLGIIGLIGFISLICFLLFDGLCKKFENKESDSNVGFFRFLASLNFFSFFLGCSAGLSTVISLCGFTKVRTYNRISVYILLFSAIFIIYLLDIILKNKKINLKSLKSKLLYSFIIIFLVAFHFYDTKLYKFKTKEGLTETYDNVINIRDYAKKIDSLYENNAHGKKANILQYPIVSYPENNIPKCGANCNLQALIYLFTKNLSFSFGSLPHTEKLYWYKQLFTNVGEGSLILNAINNNFDGLSIHTNLLPKEKTLVRKLLKLGIKPTFTDSKRELYFYDLSKINTDNILANDKPINMIDFKKYLFYGFLINEHTRHSKGKWAVGKIQKKSNKEIKKLNAILKFVPPTDKSFKIKFNFFSPIKNKMDVYINKLKIADYVINEGDNEIETSQVVVKSLDLQEPFITVTLKFDDGIIKKSLFKIKKDEKLAVAKFKQIRITYKK